MKLLLDANISWRLVANLKNYFEDCVHVDTTGLPSPPSDAAIWNYAVTHDFVIVTNDEDFMNLLNMKGFPPKIVLLRTGNQSTRYISELIVGHIADIEMLYSSEVYGLPEIY